MTEKFKIVEAGINERGFMSAGTIESLYGITRRELDAMVLLGWLCCLSDGLCYDLPPRRDKRLATVKAWFDSHAS